MKRGGNGPSEESDAEMVSKLRMDELLAAVDDVRLFELAEGVNTIGVFEYRAPNEASACALRQGLASSTNVEAVEMQAEVESKTWIVAAFVNSPGCSESDRREFLSRMKQVALAHRCRFLGWGVYDREDIIGPSGGGEPNQLQRPTDDRSGPQARNR